MKSSATAALATLALALVPASLQAREITVPSGAIHTIQQGVDAAAPGDTVIVRPGTYGVDCGEQGWPPGVSIGPDKPGLKLKAVGPPGSVKIVRVGTVPSGFSGDGIQINAANVCVEGFDISGFWCGISVSVGPAQGGRITGNTVHDCACVCIMVCGSSNCEIDHNTLGGGQIGIFLNGWLPAGPNTQHHVHHNRVTAAQTGIGVWQSPGCEIHHNECDSNGGTGVGLGCSPNCTVEHNKTDNNGSVGIPGFWGMVGNGIGINLDSSPNCAVVKNEANDNTGCGIWVGPLSDYTEVVNNEANENGSFGVSVVQNGPGCAVVNNEADHNGSIGIWVYDNSSGCTVVSNEAKDNGQDGIQTDISCGSTFAFNVAKGNVRYDLSDWDPVPTCNTYLKNRADTAFPSLALWDAKALQPGRATDEGETGGRHGDEKENGGRADGPH